MSYHISERRINTVFTNCTTGLHALATPRSISAEEEEDRNFVILHPISASCVIPSNSRSFLDRHTSSCDRLDHILLPLFHIPDSTVKGTPWIGRQHGACHALTCSTLATTSPDWHRVDWQLEQCTGNRLLATDISFSTILSSSVP